MKKNNEVKIRKAKEEDYLVVDRLYNLNYELLHKNIPNEYKMPPKPTLPRGTFINMVEDRKLLVLVAEVNKLVVGVIYGEIEKEEADEWTQNRHRLYISELSVLPEYANEGVGTQLIQEAEHWAKGKKAKYISILTYDFNMAAISFYKKNGYKPYSIQLNKRIE